MAMYYPSTVGSVTSFGYPVRRQYVQTAVPMSAGVYAPNMHMGYAAPYSAAPTMTYQQPMSYPMSAAPVMYGAAAYPGMGYYNQQPSVIISSAPRRHRRSRSRRGFLSGL
jgi:hypothetical protein